MAKLSIFGLGYVGTVTAACFAQDGNYIIGVDTNTTKVNLINSGNSPVIEKDLSHLVAKGINNKLIQATTDSRYAVLESDITFICVGTPSNPNGSLNLKFLERIAFEIGGILKNKDKYQIIVIRSTILPGTTENIFIPIVENESGKKVGSGFGVVYNPEFMRESTAVYDFYNPPNTLIGGINKQDVNAVAELYDKVKAPIVRTSIKVAEIIKYANNSFHALKVAFSNEIGNICKAVNIDSHEVMDIFCQDKKLNLSSLYLKPGFAFGGSCLPKDLRALAYKAKTLDLEVPVLKSILSSNEQQIKAGIQRILSLGKKRIGVLGFAFKAGTDDLRESPLIELIEVLIGKGYNIKIYDREVSFARLYGANKEFIEKKIPHIAELIVKEIKEIISHSEIIIIGNKNKDFASIFPRLNKNQYVLDLVRIAPEVKTKAKYEGICW